MKCLRSKPAVVIYTVLIFCFVSFQFQKNQIIIFATAATKSFLTDDVMLRSFAALGIFFLFAWFVKRVRAGRGIFFYLMAGLISLGYSFVSFMGKFYRSDQNAGLFTILGGKTALLKALACLLGGGILFFGVIMGLDLLREREETGETENPGWAGKIQKMVFGKFSFLKVSLIIFLCWLPHILLCYPGSLPPDTRTNLQQYYGLTPYTTQHPIIHTLLVGKLTELGTRLGDPNYGLYALVWLQSILTILVFSYMIWTMKRFRVPCLCRALALVMCAVTPFAIVFATKILLDGPYLLAFTLLLVELAWYLFEPEIYRKSWRHPLLTAAAVAGTFFRYNGIYMVAAVLVLVILREGYFLLKKRQKLRYSLVIILALLVPLLGMRAEVRHLNEIHDSKKIIGRAMFALPLQQVSRYMVYHGDDITEDELEKLQKVLTIPPGEYKEHYRPTNFDGVKEYFNTEATTEELLDFLRVWLKMIARHPLTCMQATLNQNYLLFCPLMTSGNFGGYSWKLKSTDLTGEDHLFARNNDNKKRVKLREKMRKYYYDFLQSPIGGVLMSIGWHTLLLFGICLYALCEKNGKLLFLAVPLLVNLATIFAGPAIFNHQRYMLPVLYTMPLLLGMFAVSRRMPPESAAVEKES